MTGSVASPGRYLAPTIAAVFALAGPTASAAAGDVRGKLASARAPVSQLFLTEAKESFGSRFLRYEQRIGGVPVLGSDVVVTDAPGHAGDLIVDATRDDIDRPPAAAVSRDVAIEAARGRVGASVLGSPVDARLFIWSPRDLDRLVWRVVSTTRTGGYEVLVDARTGGIVRVRSLTHHATGQAAVFDPNPVKTRRSRSGLSDSADADSDLLARLRRPVTLERLDDSSCLRGQWVHAFLPETGPAPGVESDRPGGIGQGQRDVCDPARDFSSITRTDDRFEAVMAYFHIDRAQAYLQSLGFSRRRGNSLVDRQIPVRVNFINDDNSYFEARRRDITLGTGGVDDGEDADVVVHEYLHAVIEDASRSFALASILESEQAGAIAEGIGDYFAVSIAERFRPSRGFRAGCFAAWDRQGEPGEDLCLRVVDSPRTRRDFEESSECVLDYIHCAGMAWSGALWEIRRRLGAGRTDRTLVQSLFSYGAGTGFDGASRALLAANQRLYRGRDARLIRSVLCRRELMRGCPAQRRGPRFTG